LDKRRFVAFTSSVRHASTTTGEEALTSTTMDAHLQALVDALDLHGAMDIIEQAHSQGFVQPHHYRQVFRILESDVVPDFASLSRIARWFTSSQPVHLDATTPEELSLWKSAIKACFKLGRSHFSHDLSGLLQAFASRTKLDQVADADLWGIVLRVMLQKKMYSMNVSVLMFSHRDTVS
jgi:hypothetical protein